jgi:DNA invertase Pin-like site-specific DNA recombinase
MSTQEKITSSHRERLAIIYVRQSTLAQVRVNTESTQRQYALGEQAQRLGWDHARVLVIDCDLGVSGRSAQGRAGFNELVGRVCAGEVGAIFGLEVSRLARSTADLQRLLELCGLTDTLIADADGVYDLRSFNDRMLVGLKGTMSEAELHVLASRLQGAKRAAAQRGELRCALPIGYVYDADGQTVIDPDDEVRHAVEDVFGAFAQTGSAYGVVGAFAGRRFPKRAAGAAAGELGWGRLTYSRAIDTLTNPVYAGAYVFGRYRSRRAVCADGTITTKTVQLPRAEWQVLICDHHPGYVSWDAYLATEQRLAANHTARGARPPREGGALLQGIVQCGACARTMSTTHQRNGSGRYACARSRAEHLTTAACRSVTARMIDELVARQLLAALEPDQVALALDCADEVSQRLARVSRALELRVERARYDATRAERAFALCDPENRLVARSLESRWEQKLRDLHDAETELAAEPAPAPQPTRDEIETLARDLPTLSAASATTDRDRKRLLRALIADVTLTPVTDSTDELRVGIRWRSGATEQHVIARPTPAAQASRTPGAAVELVRRHAAQRSNRQLADELNAAGLRTGRGRPFDRAAVRHVRNIHNLPDAPDPELAADELTPRQLADRLGVSRSAVYYWIRHDQLQARQAPDGPLRIPFRPDIERALRERVANSAHISTQTQTPQHEDAL